MITLNLTTNGTGQELIKKYLEENASEILAEKINNGVAIEKDGKTLINKKTLDEFMKYANEEARKIATKGEQFACIEDTLVFGWAIHFFEEDSIEGTLFNEDGTPYKPVKPTVKKTVNTAPTVKTAITKKEPEGQLSLFDFSSGIDGNTEETTPDTAEASCASEAEEIVEKNIDTNEQVQPQISSLYTRYLALSEKYPTTIIALRVGDFYEIFGESATRVAEHLELTLVSRDFGLETRTPMIGFPYHKEEQYRTKLRKITSVAIAENEDNIKFYLQYQPDGSDLSVNAETGEVVENKMTTVTDDLIGILFGILKDEVEVRL